MMIGNQTTMMLKTLMHLLTLNMELGGTGTAVGGGSEGANDFRINNLQFNDHKAQRPLPPNWWREEPTNINEDDAEMKCYPAPYGCFSIGHPWNEHRPATLFPEHPDKVNPGFCLYTNTLPTGTCQPLDMNNPSSIYRSPIEGAGTPTFFIIHGYLESGNKTWVKNMARELLRSVSKANVLAVNWQSGAEPPYAQAVANTRIVGQAVAVFIHKLKVQIGLDVSTTHVIGHSLGSHTAGYAGHALKEKWGLKLGRITGMDPAEPHFVDTDPKVRLDPEDASFVDVIHTDTSPFISGGFGMRQPVGHLDFYPNGGESQPGCSNNVLDQISNEGSFILGVRRAIGCNHLRSHEFFTESINSRCDFLAVECESWERFEDGQCFSCPANNFYDTKPACAKFGFKATRIPPRQNVQLFFKTGANPPYCRQHYLVEIEISNSSLSNKHGGEVGEIWLEMEGDTGITERIRFNEAGPYQPGAKQRRVVAGSGVGQLRSATVEWVFRSTLFNPLSWRSFFTTSQIYLERLKVHVLETQQRLDLCTGSEPLLSGTPRTFTRADECPMSHPPKH